MQINNTYYFIFLILKLIRTSDSSSTDESLSYDEILSLMFQKCDPAMEQSLVFTLLSFEFEIARADIDTQSLMKSYRNVTLGEMMSKVRELEVKLQGRKDMMKALSLFKESFDEFKETARFVVNAYLTMLQSVSAKQPTTFRELLDRREVEELRCSETGNVARCRQDTDQGFGAYSESVKDGLIESQNQVIANLNQEVCKLERVVAQIRENNENVLRFSAQDNIWRTKLEEAKGAARSSESCLMKYAREVLTQESLSCKDLIPRLLSKVATFSDVRPLMNVPFDSLTPRGLIKRLIMMCHDLCVEKDEAVKRADMVQKRIDVAERSYRTILGSHEAARPQIRECANKIKQIVDDMDVTDLSTDDEDEPSDAVRKTLPQSPQVARPRLQRPSFDGDHKYEPIPVESMSSPKSRPCAAGDSGFHFPIVDPSTLSKTQPGSKNKQDVKNTLAFDKIVELCNKLNRGFYGSTAADEYVLRPVLVELKSACEELKAGEDYERSKNVACVALHRYEQTEKDLAIIKKMVEKSLSSGACTSERVKSVMSMVCSIESMMDHGAGYATVIRRALADGAIGVPARRSPLQEPESLQSPFALDRAGAKGKTKRNIAGPMDVKHGASLTADQVSKSPVYTPSQFGLTQDRKALANKLRVFLKKLDEKDAASAKAVSPAKHTSATPNEAVSSSKKRMSAGKLQQPSPASDKDKHSPQHAKVHSAEQPSAASDKEERPLQHAKVLSGGEALEMVTTVLKQPFQVSAQSDSQSKYESALSSPTESSIDNENIVAFKKKISPTYLVHLTLSDASSD